MLDWMKRQELSGNCSARDRFRSCRRNQDGEEVAGQALHLQCLGGVHFNLLKENKNFQTQNTVLVAHIQEQLGDSPADFLLKQKHGGVSVPLVSVERQSCWRPGNPSFAPFEVGQLVKRETQRPGNLLTGKFEQRFDGPFKVKSRNSNDVTYTLERDTGAELRAHHTQLRPWITAPSYLRRLEEVREDGEGRGCSMHPPLPAGGVLTSVGSAGERRLPGILKNTRRAQDRSQQTTPPRVSSSAQQTTPPPRVSSSAQQTTPPPKNDGAQLAVSRPPASAPQQRTRATSAAKRTVRFDDVGREIPRRSGRVREAPDRWGYS
ncbi:hypothetical protein FJT64_018583 [Amphibalanus amphitrite]|nr:hypothetical protein FJT64_018583 [Amphibalanus amphitrite]